MQNTYLLSFFSLAEGVNVSIANAEWLEEELLRGRGGEGGGELEGVT
jgi:hypothetical protein